jgi:hypothetical protein
MSLKLNLFNSSENALPVGNNLGGKITENTYDARPTVPPTGRGYEDFALLNNLRVKNVDGVLTLKGTIVVHFWGTKVTFAGTERKIPVQDYERSKILEGLKALNQTAGRYAVDLEFVDADNFDSNNRHRRGLPHANLTVTTGDSTHVITLCQASVSGCNKKGGLVVLNVGASGAVAAHEVGHVLGVPHNSLPGSLMNGDGYVGYPNTGFSPGEIRAVVEAYMKK